MHPGLLIGAGFLLGTVGLKAATSDQAKRVYVKGIVQGMRLKEEAETMVDQAKAEFDDLLAEAGYEKKNLEAAEKEKDSAKGAGKGRGRGRGAGNGKGRGAK